MAQPIANQALLLSITEQLKISKLELFKAFILILNSKKTKIKMQ